MKLLDHCILCGSSNLDPYSMRFKVGFPHISRVRCRSCTGVFANPMAEENELIEFYQNYYDKGNFKLIMWKEGHIKRFNAYAEMDQFQIEKKLNYVLKYKKSGNFLDIGFGLGEPLYLAHLHGFNVFGTEYDAASINFLKKYIPNGSWHRGDVMDSNFQLESFDFIRFYHVIEHVISPQTYVKVIYKLLKPGGVLMIGTPNIKCSGYRIYRILKFISLSIPGIIDGMEHTVLFNKATLSKIVTDEGLEIIDHFTHSNTEKLKELLLSEISIWKKIVGFLESIFHVNQIIYAKKPL
jgi:2-polyprenyl-3-methyl-5-hydroxy-6-metoxy-1,4-benzoquinol methylase